MAEHLPTVMPCEPKWEEGIYQLEVDDRVLGYNKDTHVDGKSNLQGLQLGNRTLYLRDLLGVEHTDGQHVLTDTSFAENAGIVEPKLVLDHGTQELQDLLHALHAEYLRSFARVESVINIGLSFAEAMCKLVPLYQEYANTRCAYELFVPEFSARPLQGTKIIKEIAGDDSLDVESTAGITPGTSYFLMDEDCGRREEATVLSVLTEQRIRFTTALRYTRHSGTLSMTSLVPISGYNGGARATRDFVYLSDQLDVLEGAVSGRVFVHRDAGETGKKLFYNVKNTSEWVEVSSAETRHYIDGTVDDMFLVPAENMRIRLEYSGGSYPYTVHYIVVQPIRAVVWIEDVRYPRILSVNIEGDQATVDVTPYASLYDMPQQATEVCLSSHQYFGEIVTTQLVPGDASSVQVTIPEELLNRRSMFVTVRHSDIEGICSRWSESFHVTF